MPRQKKDAKILNIKLATPISDRLESFCEESGQNKTVAVERALVAYMDDYDEKQALLRKLESKQGGL